MEVSAAVENTVACSEHRVVGLEAFCSSLVVWVWFFWFGFFVWLVG